MVQPTTLGHWAGAYGACSHALLSWGESWGESWGAVLGSFSPPSPGTTPGSASPTLPNPGLLSALGWGPGPRGGRGDRQWGFHLLLEHLSAHTCRQQACSSSLQSQ